MVEAVRALPFPVLALIPGAETGVELADQLSYRLNLRSNGIRLSNARRNKYHMGEAVRSAGLRAVKQQMCYSVTDVREFLDTLTSLPFKCVVKPVQSAGSDDVFLCNSKDEAITAFGKIAGT
jgi:biotin carboxylase